MLDRLTVDDFRPAVGSTFTLHAGDQRLSLKLLEAQTFPKDAPARDGSGARAPFDLQFLGPPDPVLAQHIYRLEHQALGTLEIFLVPLGRDDSGTTYEAVFA